MSVVPDDPDAPPLPGIAELQIQLGELRRRLEVNDEEIDILQVASARQSRSWFQDPSALTAIVAVVISLLSTVIGQYNVTSDREIQKRARLTALIQQLPAAQQQLTEKPTTGTDGLLLVAGDAAQLMSEIDSSSFEKIEVANALVLATDYGRALDLARKGAADSTGLLETMYANRLIAQISFLTGDIAGGRATFVRVLALLGNPTPQADSPLLRRYQTAFTEAMWSETELAYARDCAAAEQHLANARTGYASLPGSQLGGQLDGLTKAVTAQCP